MYPGEELAALARAKAARRRAIADGRRQCVAAATGASRPLAWLEAALGWWRRIAPLAREAALPVGLAVVRSLLPRGGIARSLLRWAPVVISGVSVLLGGRRSR